MAYHNSILHTLYDLIMHLLVSPYLHSVWRLFPEPSWHALGPRPLWALGPPRWWGPHSRRQRRRRGEDWGVGRYSPLQPIKGCGGAS